jgi:hypothetical protein
VQMFPLETATGQVDLTMEEIDLHSLDNPSLRISP